MQKYNDDLRHKALLVITEITTDALFCHPSNQWIPTSKFCDCKVNCRSKADEKSCSMYNACI